MVEFLKNHHCAKVIRNSVKGRKPYRPEKPTRKQIEPYIARYLDMHELSAMIWSIERDGKKYVPVLLRHYLKLGGEVAAFNVDQRFSNCLDALIIVDITKAPVPALRRYMGKEAADAFLAAHYDKRQTNLAS